MTDDGRVPVERRPFAVAVQRRQRGLVIASLLLSAHADRPTHRRWV